MRIVGKYCGILQLHKPVQNCSRFIPNLNHLGIKIPRYNYHNCQVVSTLVEAIGNHETLTAEEEQQMEHIRSCKECMESYCIMAVLAEATRVDCDLVLNPVYSEEETAESARKLLAAIRVTCERI